MDLFVGISELVQPHAREGSSDSPLDLTRDAALLVHDGVVVAAGPRAELAAIPSTRTAAVHDLGERAVVPGLIDSHTHVVFAGDRVDELARRARGDTYTSIAKAGGGIARSVRSLTEASEQEVVRASQSRLAAMLARGTTTVEVKSGYGLTPAQELRHLRLVAAVARVAKQSVFPTLLAHVLPSEERTPGRRAEFVRRFAEEALGPAAKEHLARFIDVFVEEGAYSQDEARALAREAARLGLGLKLHVDQFSDSGGAALAAELGALSADHLEHVSPSGRASLAARGVVACLLPGCGLFLSDAPWPDGRALRNAGCEVAVATDCNPGSSMVTDLALCATLAATRCRLTLEEAFWGVTRGGARALGLEDRGRLAVGERADFVVVGNHDWRTLLYEPGRPAVDSVFIAGERVAPEP